jgi:hypothetical protein
MSNIKHKILNGVSYAPGQTITLIADHKKISAVKVLDEMVALCKNHHLRSVELFYYNYKFTISSDSSVEDLICEFVLWLDEPKRKTIVMDGVLV